MEEEIKRLQMLVDTAATIAVGQIRDGNNSGLKELLWNVPTNLLMDFIERNKGGKSHG